jgi:penicillin-binding protein 2
MKTMKKKRFLDWLVGLIAAGMLVSCAQPATEPAALPPTERPLPTLSVLSGAPEDTEVIAAAQAYLDGWKAKDYAAMYDLLTSLSKDALSEEEFTEHYQGVASEAVLTDLNYELQSLLVKPDSAQVGYRVTLDSVLVGEIARETVMNLRREKNEWRVQWDDTLVLPELRGGNYLMLDRNGYTPSRANIYDRKGQALVAQTDATAIGVNPDELDPGQRAELLATLSELLGQSVEILEQRIASVPVGAGWYLPLGEVSADRIVNKYDQLAAYSGLVLSPYKARYYFDGGVAPHVVGYVAAIQPDEVEAYQMLGYEQDDRVGRSGLEQWAEPYLAGKRGGALYVLNGEGQLVTRLAEIQAEPAQELYTTLDRDLQKAAQQAIKGFKGSIVVLERDSGRVLALVSSPGYNPNAFEPVNFNGYSQLAEITANPENPLLNRAVQGQYPLGSVFKIITMAAGLESGVYKPDTTYQCGYLFEELPGVALHDWTYDYYLSDGRTIPSGLLTLKEGLMRSCNPYFWHIGLDLFSRGRDTAVSEMARSFGLGKPTGLEGLDELPGQIPDPANVVDAVNMAIGQGDVLVTPLQVAAFAAAIGNGGILYRPQLIEKIVPPDGKPGMVFEPEVMGTLPLSPENLQAIQEAMLGVIRNEQPRGTAWHRFTGLDVPVAGKTGTAQSGSDRPHAWFAGYTFAGREDKPDIAIAVVVENIGEGSDYAAPIFRRLVELYYTGQPQKLYWWESAYNVPFAPTPTPEATPQPGATPAP